MEQHAVSRYREIDDCLSGEHDMINLIKIDEGKVLEYGPSPCALFKFFNSHDDKTDKIEVDGKAYGSVSLTNRGSEAVFPTVSDVKRVFGVEDNDCRQ